MLYCKHECGFLILRNQKGCAMMNKFDFMGKDAISKMEDLMNVSRLNEQEEKNKKCILWVLAIFGALAAVAAIAYCL